MPAALQASQLLLPQHQPGARPKVGPGQRDAWGGPPADGQAGRRLRAGAAGQPLAPPAGAHALAELLLPVTQVWATTCRHAQAAAAACVRKCKRTSLQGLCSLGLQGWLALVLHLLASHARQQVQCQTPQPPADRPSAAPCSWHEHRPPDQVQARVRWVAPLQTSHAIAPPSAAGCPVPTVLVHSDVVTVLGCRAARPGQRGVRGSGATPAAHSFANAQGKWPGSVLTRQAPSSREISRAVRDLARLLVICTSPLAAGLICG